MKRAPIRAALAVSGLAALAPSAVARAGATPHAATPPSASVTVSVDSDAPWRPLVWDRLPAIDPSLLEEPNGLDDRLAKHAVELAPQLALPLEAARAAARDSHDHAPLAAFATALALTRDPVAQALVAALEGRARLGGAVPDARPPERDAFDVSRTLAQARLATTDPELGCVLSLASGRAAARAGLTSESFAAYHAAHCDSVVEQAHAHLAEGLLLVTLGRKGEAEKRLAGTDLATLPSADQALALAARGDLELKRGETSHAIDRYREAGRRAPAPDLPVAVAIRVSEAARLEGDLGVAILGLIHTRRAVLRGARTDTLAAWLTLRIASIELAAGQVGAARTELGGAGDSDAANLRRLDTRQAFALNSRASTDIEALAAEYLALARGSRDPLVVEEASFKTAWLSLRAGNAAEARDAFASFRAIHAASPLASAAGRGVDLALEQLVATLATEGDSLALARVVARDRELLSTSSAGPRLWMLAGWALESLGLDREAEALYRRTRARLPDSEQSCAQHLDANLAAIALRHGDPAAARAILGHDVDDDALDLLAVWRPSPMSESGCTGNLVAGLARDPALAIAAARHALDRDDCAAARAHLDELGERPGKEALEVADLEHRCGADARAVALVTPGPSGALLEGEALGIALLSTDRFPETGDVEPVHVTPTSSGVWAQWARTRQADRQLAIELQRSRILP